MVDEVYEWARNNLVFTSLICGALGIVAFAVSELGYGDLEVKVESVWLTITNVGTRPLTIRDINVNGRSECRLTFFGGREFSPLTLNVGDAISLASACGIVRATIKTGQKTLTYTFR